MTPGVLVVGSHGGIGASVIHALADEGTPVSGVDRDSIDITKPGGAEAAVAQAVSELGDLSGVVHAIGMSGRRLGDGSILECTDEAWLEIHRVNLESAFRLIRASMPHLIERGGGSIVVIGSGLATTLDDDFLTVAYSTAKAALTPMIRSAAFSGAPHHVRVNLVSPGVVDTPMAQRAIQSPRLARRLAALQPLTGGAQSPETVAQAVVWLLSARSEAVSGATLAADAGWTLR